jgi:hypothetical protein
MASGVGAKTNERMTRNESTWKCDDDGKEADHTERHLPCFRAPNIAVLTLAQ